VPDLPTLGQLSRVTFIEPVRCPGPYAAKLTDQHN